MCFFKMFWHFSGIGLIVHACCRADLAKYYAFELKSGRDVEMTNHTIKLKRGLVLPVAGEPEQAVYDGPKVRTVAL